MNKFIIKNLFKKKTQMVNFGYSPAWPVNFIRDWKILVLIFAAGLIILSVFIWRIYLSDKIGGGYLTSTEVVISTSIKTLDKNKLQADLLILQTKQNNFLKLKSNPLQMADPSL